MSTNIPDLLDRISANRTLVGQVVPVAAVPLILLCWFVIYLAVAAATEQRRPEFGLLALRGVPRGPTWLLALGPSVVPVLVGAPVGYLLGLIAVNAFADATLPAAVPAPLTPDYHRRPRSRSPALCSPARGASGSCSGRRSVRSVRRVRPRAGTAGSSRRRRPP